MKNIIITLILFIPALAIARQDPPMLHPTAEWYYEVKPGIACMPCYVNYHHVKVVGDTLIHDKEALILQKISTLSMCDDMGGGNQYLYAENGIVFWYNPYIDDFTVLYDFTAEKGDSWQITVRDCSFTVMVDSVSTLEINGLTRKVLHIADENDYFTGTLVENIGHLQRMFPRDIYFQCQGSACDSDFIDGLRCYLEDQSIVYKNTEVACDSIYSINVATETIAQDREISIHPNPVKDSFSLHGITALLSNGNHFRYQIINTAGQCLYSGRFNPNAPLNVAQLQRGIYILRLWDAEEKVTFTTRFIKE